MNRQTGLEFALQQLPQPHCLNVVLCSLMSHKGKEEVEMINHHESPAQAEATAGRGTDGRAVLTRSTETSKHWEGMGTGQAAWRDNLFFPQHLTLSLLCQPSGHGCHCFCCLCCFSTEKGFLPQTLELCLCQDREV